MKIYFIQCCINKSGNSEFKESLKSLKSPSPLLDSILKLKGGYDELTDEEQEKLINSLLAKVPQSSYQETSINKLFKRVLKIIEPVISDQRFWRILSESEKPIKSQLPDPSGVRSTDILAPAENEKENQAKTGSKGSSIFVHRLVDPMPRRKHALLPSMELNMAQTPTEDSFSNRLTPSGLSVNHEELSENIQFIERVTKLRRAEPLYSSEILGESFQYSQEQLEIKAPRHLLDDYNVSLEGKTLEEQGLAYFHEVEEFLKTPNLIVREDGTMNHQEPSIIFFNEDSRLFVSFENNPLYKDHHFINSYKIIPEAVEEFRETGNIGESPETRKLKIDQDQRLKAAQERIQTNQKSFYLTLPEDARLGNRQLREAEMLQEQLKVDSNFQLTDKEKSLLERAQKYETHKKEFYKNNSDLFNDEL